MNDQKAIAKVMRKRILGTRVGMLTSVCLFAVTLSSVGAEQALNGLLEEHPAVAQRLALCIRETGSEYVDAREALLGLGEAKLRVALAKERLIHMQWNARLVAGIMRGWAENPDACNNFHTMFDACIRSSYATQTGRPSERRITGCCVREWDKGAEPEMLILERLFKYEDPPHVKEGIIIALGAKGSIESLSAVRWLMISTEDVDLSFHCVRAVGKLSRKFSDATVVPDLVRLYRTIERPSMKDVPRELKGKVPPPFQRQVVSALRQIESAESLRALDDLQRTETDHVLVSIIEDARDAVRATVKAEQN